MDTKSPHQRIPRKKVHQGILRYRDEQHQELVKKCAAHAGLSINAWLCQLTLRAAREEAAEAGIAV